MRLQEAAIALGVLVQPVVSAESDVPRGVGPEFAKFYSNKDSFTCISNPDVKLPSSRVNDNYCDCPDGSDEPGTSACAHLSHLSPNIQPSATGAGDFNTTPALPGFYCRNKHHNPSYIPFTHVNDGICDHEVCCDGSDEWAQVGGVKCENRCKAIGAEWRKADEKRQISLTTAGRRRADLVAAASKKKKEIQDFIESSKGLIESFEVKVQGLEKEADEIEKSEKSKVVRKVGKGGRTSVLAGLAKDKLADLRDSLAHVIKQREAENTRLQELEGLLGTFKEEYNPNFNDEGVKRAVRGYEEYIARNNVEAGDQARERKARDHDAGDLANGADGIPWEDFEGEEEGLVGDIETLYSFEEYLPASLKDWLDSQLRSFRQVLVDNGILAATSPSDTAESTAVTEAKARLREGHNDLDNARRQRTEHEEDLVRDYGPDDVFRTMKGACIATDAGEYTYELCWLDSVTQKPKKGGMHNNMGRFSRFDNVHVDEDVAPDGNGLGTGDRLAQRYEGGAGCWQGPARATTVVMACAETEEIWKVVEEEKCIYRMEVGTPAVCGIPENVAAEAKKVGMGKDEL